MAYRVYPVFLFLACVLSLLAGFVIIRSFTSVDWPLLLIPIPAVIIGYILTTIIASRFPKIRYVNESEIEGLGYVYQPLGPMLLLCLIGFSVAILQLLR